MRINIYGIQLEALHLIQNFAHENGCEFDKNGECAGCRFHMTEDPETTPMSREPREYCALGIVRELIMEIEREEKSK